MSIGADGRCTLPSTHIRGGGYVEVECYCEAHALDAAKKYGDTELPRVLDPNHGCLDTTVGLVRNRRRCQWEEKDREHQAAAAELAAAVDAVRRESAALFEQEYALRRGLYAENERLRAENTTLREAAVELGLRAGGAGGGVASLAEEVARLRRLLEGSSFPIETAPMWGPILCFKPGMVGTWRTEFCVPEDFDAGDVNEWRAQLKADGYTRWMPNPPYPKESK